MSVDRNPSALTLSDVMTYRKATSATPPWCPTSCAKPAEACDTRREALFWTTVTLVRVPGTGSLAIDHNAQRLSDTKSHERRERCPSLSAQMRQAHVARGTCPRRCDSDNPSCFDGVRQPRSRMRPSEGIRARNCGLYRG